MRTRQLNNTFAPLVCLLLCLAGAWSAYGQTPTEKQDIDVLRINTELVQSPVMVFDKQGHFVDGLQREQFELLVDGRPQPITFFDRVTAGTAAETVKLEAARKGGTKIQAAALGSKGSVYGRTLIFFVDDFHLSSESISRVRASLLRFIDASLGQNDRALLTSASGNLGFLQQLTDNKEVLYGAAEKLRSKYAEVLDDERPPMATYQALSIQRNDSEVLKYYVEIYFADYVQNMFKSPPPQGGKNAGAIAQAQGEQGRRIAEIHVRARARNIINHYTSITASSFAALRYLMSDTLELSGSKLIFVISDGFYLNRNVPGESQKLNEVTSAALRAGAVIYSIQASGLGSQYPDAKTDLRQGHNMPMNLPRSGNDQELQAPLYTLAVDTGGRAFFNSNSIDAGIKQALAETSEYYLIAWRPNGAEQAAESFKEIQVRVKDRPELTVRVHKGYLTAAAKNVASAKSGNAESPPAANAAGVAVGQKAVDEKLSATLSKSNPISELPTSLSARFSDVADQGEQISVATEISTSELFAAAADRQTRVIDLLGVVLNDNGKSVASFKGQLNAGAPAAANSVISQTTDLKVKPGLYQVRVVARDQKSGLTGSAFQWVTVPDLTQKRLALSSLFVGDRKRAEASDPRVPLSINHHFTPDSRIRFFASIYNAARGSEAGAKPDVSIQTRIFRDDQTVFTGPVVRAATEGVDDLTRLPYAAEISLRTLKPGRYLLELTATDNVAKTSSSQRLRFVVD
ncbi:MAG TPA: VWA domain-containing protein [Pyrinomonadaceae bacterium]|nr:VWA domain-containing protein [Pyrinomonadaceae bacterium]